MGLLFRSIFLWACLASSVFISMSDGKSRFKRPPTLSMALADLQRLSQKRPQIIGGVRASENTLSHLVNLLIQDPNGSFGYCSGTILDNRRILTAAHCMYFRNQIFIQNIFVVAVQLRRTVGPIYVARSIDVFRQFNIETLQNDLAIITVNGKIRAPFNSVVIPPTTFKTPKGSIAYAAGYGQVGNGQRLANVLRQVDLRIRAVSKCKLRFLEEIRDTFVKSEIICGVDPNQNAVNSKSVCGGDSGGPLFYLPSNNTGRFTQIGITSFTEDVCSSQGSTSFFTNVKTYSDAISEHGGSNLTQWVRVFTQFL